MRKLITAVAVAGLMGAIGGCNLSSPVQRVQNAPADVLNDTPLIVDQAMQNRDFDRPVAYYANGDVIAGPTGFRYEPSAQQPGWVQGLVDVPLFIGQTVALPVTLVLDPPWKEVRYTGVTTPPTSTAMPLLPGAATSATPSYPMMAPEPVAPDVPARQPEP